MFLAALYAPSDTIEIEIHQKNKVNTYVQDAGIWTSKDNSSDVFLIRRYKLLSPSGFLDLETELGDVFEHEWSVESVLRVSSGIEVLKTKEGLLIYPDGIRGADEPIRVIYKNPPPRFRRKVAE